MFVFNDFMNTDYKNQITFTARIGKNLKMHLLNNEFYANPQRVEKFERMFYDTFKKNIDTNTVLEMDSRGKFYLYNIGLKGVKHSLKIFASGGNIANKILQECSTVFSRAEYVLFQKYISTNVLKGKSLEKIKAVGETKLNGVRKHHFNDLVGTAQRILKQNPESKLTEYEFSDMITTQIREVVETPEFQRAMSQNIGKALDMLRKSKN